MIKGPYELLFLKFKRVGIFFFVFCGCIQYIFMSSSLVWVNVRSVLPAFFFNVSSISSSLRPSSLVEGVTLKKDKLEFDRYLFELIISFYSNFSKNLTAISDT